MDRARRDWFVLRARWDIRLILVVIPLLYVVALVGGLLSARDAMIDMNDSSSGIATDLFATYRVPRSIISLLASGPWLSFGMAYVGAVALGNEFGWGTIRTALTSDGSRSRFLASRMMVVVLLAALLVGTVASIATAGDLFSTIVGMTPPIDRPTLDVPVLVAEMLSVVGVVVGYAVGGMALAAFTRNAFAPLLIGLVVLVSETLVSLLPVWNGFPMYWVPRLFFSNSTGALLLGAERSAGVIDPLTRMPSALSAPWPVAAAIVAAWTAGLVALSFVLLDHADIVE